MDLIEAIPQRHSVRRYTDQPITGEILAALEAEVERSNAESGLHLQLALDEPEAFSTPIATYGSFRNVRHYLALVGIKSPRLDETIGWYGERFVLTATSLGLDTCWVALNYSKRKTKAVFGPGEVLRAVIPVGYGVSHGHPHKPKPLTNFYRLLDTAVAPDWFLAGVEAARLAPTAVNQQHFRFSLSGTQVQAQSLGGPYANIDLGIVKYHFQLGAGVDHFSWAE